MTRQLAWIVVLPVLAACATAKDTPQQEYVWAMGRICDSRSNQWYLDAVKPDGSYTVRGATNSVPAPNIPYFDCMREQFKAHPYGEWMKTRQTQ